VICRPTSFFSFAMSSAKYPGKRRERFDLRFTIFTKNQPKPMVAESKNRKFEIFFYYRLYKDLQQKRRLHFCRFSHQTRRLLQLWGAVFRHVPKDGNPKYEYLNPKQYRITEIQNSKRQAQGLRPGCFEHLKFEFVSYFGFGA